MNTVEEKIKQKALVVLSGGQDSVTCLGYALAKFESVEAISFVYNQKHEAEIACAKDICGAYKVKQKIVNLGFLSELVTTALTKDSSFDVCEKHPHKEGLPASFVPNRNALFLTTAHAYAQEIGAEVIVTGVCQTDYSGYPDCRDAFVRAINLALNIGYNTSITILTPLMHLNKAQTFALAAEVGFLGEVIENSHTCYNGDHSTFNEWGFGCGKCPACLLRKKGFEEYKAMIGQ